MSATPALRPLKPTPCRLGGLARALDLPAPSADGAVTGVTLNSRAVRQGDLFAALPGANAHGVSYLAGALAGGAAAVLTDAAGRDAALATGLPVLVVDRPRGVLGRVAAYVYGEPSAAMQVIGVTGTNGKTTTAYLLEHGLRQAGLRTGLIGTVETRIAGEAVPSTSTTPEAPDLQATLAAMREHGVTAVAMEVSSHGLALGRVDGTRFAAGAFTNLSQDHLDFHADMEDYFAAKARLFDGRAEREVVNVDDAWGRRLVTPATVTVSTLGDPAAAWRVAGVRADPAGGQRFRVLGPGGVDLPASIRLPGAFNLANALLAIATLATVGVDLTDAAKGVAETVVPGRMEPVDAGQSFAALVDYAHAPDPVARLLAAVRPGTAGRVITVLGCGGDRDRGKRPMMGAAAARGSDLLIVTDDNPRSEDPAAIRAAMRAGAVAVPPGERGEVTEVGDRRAAIEAAVTRARPGDTVVIAGRGHEPGQQVGTEVLPFDDRAVLRAAIEQVAAAAGGPPAGAGGPPAGASGPPAGAGGTFAGGPAAGGRPAGGTSAGGTGAGGTPAGGSAGAGGYAGGAAAGGEARR
ncbi:MAG: UDP-N-acetylmuramoyl-L-alanyl-D-glutamate--2,6-diaminopimelate ligase [Mycobacteriales bacterium]